LPKQIYFFFHFRTPGSVLRFAVLGLDFFILHVPVHNPLVQFVYLCPCVLAYYFYSRICPFSLAALFCEKAAQKSSQAFLSCKYKNNVSSNIARAQAAAIMIVHSSR